MRERKRGVEREEGEVEKEKEEMANKRNGTGQNVVGRSILLF